MALTPVDGHYPEKLKGKGFTMYSGWSESVANAVVRNSRQPHILAYTPRDAGERFISRESAMRWHKMGKRTIYTLYAEGDNLAGLIWGDERPRPDLDATHTFAIQLYQEAMGKKLAEPFMEAAFDESIECSIANDLPTPVVWLERTTADLRTKHLYEKFGFISVQEAEGRTTMVLRPEHKYDLRRRELLPGKD